MVFLSRTIVVPFLKLIVNPDKIGLICFQVREFDCTLNKSILRRSCAPQPESNWPHDQVGCSWAAGRYTGASRRCRPALWRPAASIKSRAATSLRPAASGSSPRRRRGQAAPASSTRTRGTTRNHPVKINTALVNSSCQFVVWSLIGLSRIKRL